MVKQNRNQTTLNIKNSIVLCHHFVNSKSKPSEKHQFKQTSPLLLCLAVLAHCWRGFCISPLPRLSTKLPNFLQKSCRLPQLSCQLPAEAVTSSNAEGYAASPILGEITTWTLIDVAVVFWDKGS